MQLKKSIAALAMLAATSVALAQTKHQVQFFATGGTIAMKIDPVKNAPVPAISGEDLLAIVPDVGKYADIRVTSLSNVPSDYMDPPRWMQLTKAVQEALDKPDVAGVIVSHGTDTLEETAFWLDLTVKSNKPVTLIGAQRNASASDFDGPRALLANTSDRGFSCVPMPPSWRHDATASASGEGHETAADDAVAQ